LTPLEADEGIGGVVGSGDVDGDGGGGVGGVVGKTGGGVWNRLSGWNRRVKMGGGGVIRDRFDKSDPIGVSGGIVESGKKREGLLGS